jgi:hypothetical protein
MSDILRGYITDTLIAADPTNIAVQKIQETAQGLGGGSGAVLLSIPGIGKPFINALNSLKQQSQNIIVNAQNMSPEQIIKENDRINNEYNTLVSQARASNTSPPPPPQTMDKKIYSAFSTFFSSMFSTTLNIFLFSGAIFLGLLGSSMAANSIGLEKPTAYYVYYMFYGFILFFISIPLCMYRYYIVGKKPMFHAIWAPIHKGKYDSPMMNLLMYFFIYNPIESDILPHYQSTVMAVELPPSNEV